MIIDEIFWSDLLLAIEDGHVVPVVGPGLIQVDTESGPVSLNHYLAQQLAIELGVQTECLPLNFDTNDVICATKDFQGDPSTFYRCMLRIVGRLQLDTPEVLYQLASIDAFGLFINVSYDSLLETALLETRGVNPIVLASKCGPNDIPIANTSSAVVYHLFGLAKPRMHFAFTDGQQLEHMHYLLSSPSAPKVLLDRLRESHLLLLGVSFPDWLARLFIRLAREKPLWDSRSVMEIVTESDDSKNQLIGFLQRFSPRQTHIPKTVDPKAFVAELHSRWKSRRLSTSGHVVSVMPQKPKGMATGSVFLSYAREDREAAARIAKLFEEQRIEAWMDERLVPGDDYEDLILSRIRTCGAFIPILSKHTANDEERWFRREWGAALDRLSALRCTGRKFIFPILIGNITERELAPHAEEILRHQTTRLTEIGLIADLYEQLRDAQRLYRRDLTAGCRLTSP